MVYLARGHTMPFRIRNMLRETATALAVLSLYVLMLLAALHQAAGLQRDLNALGFSALDTWSICVPLTQGDTNDAATIAKCPAAGIGKHELALPTPPSMDIGAPDIASQVFYPERVIVAAHMGAGAPMQARAPPVSA